MDRFQKDAFPALASMLLAFIVYLFTLCPAMPVIDAGELAAVQATGGVAHPTGYPLFTILGYVWSLINPGFAVIHWLNLLSAAWTAAGAYFLHRFLVLVFRTVKIPVASSGNKKTTVSDKILPFWPMHLVAAAAALLIAFSRTFWMQSTGVEVYSLHILCISLVLFFTARALQASSTAFRNWWPVALCVGLGFANHLSMLMITPGILVLFGWKEGLKLKTAIGGVLLLLVGMGTSLLIYLWLPLASAADPLLDWGNPESPVRFFRHITGKQYQDWMFTGSKVRSENLEKFFKGFEKEYSLVGWALLLAGLWEGWKHHRKIVVFLALNFVVCVGLAVNYGIKDLESYFLLALISAGLIMGLGMLLILRWVPLLYEKTAASALFLLISGFLLFYNVRTVDRSDYIVVSEITEKSLNSLPPDAVLLSRQWDILVSPALYYQFVEGLRKDIWIVDKELLRRTWYLDQIERWNPDAAVMLKDEKEALKKALYPFENDLPYQPTEIQPKFEAYITALLVKSMETRPVYVSPELLNEISQQKMDVVLPEGYILVPQRLFYRLSSDTSYAPLEDTVKTSLHFPEGFDPRKKDADIYLKSIYDFAGSMLAERISYEIAYNRKDEAYKLFLEYRELNPTATIPKELEGLER